MEMSRGPHFPLLTSGGETSAASTSLTKAKSVRLEKFTAKYDGKRPDALIFKGGGTKGVVYSGALKRLEEAGVVEGIKKFAGTSAGSQVAALLAFGYTGDELKEINRTSPWDRLLDRNRGPCGLCANLTRLVRKFGICKGTFLENYLDDLFAKKCGMQRCTFQQLYDLNGHELKLGTCNMITKRFEFLDYHTHPDMPIAVACRASSSIPIVFKPVRWRNALYVDGGLEGNLPVSAFKHGDTKTIAFNLVPEAKDESSTIAQAGPTGIIDFLSVAIDMLLEAAQGAHGVDTINARGHALSGEGVDIVNICTGPFGALDTGMSEEEINTLIKSGYDAVDEYFSDK